MEIGFIRFSHLMLEAYCKRLRPSGPHFLDGFKWVKSESGWEPTFFWCLVTTAQNHYWASLLDKRVSSCLNTDLVLLQKVQF
jgi:hypothetical protein